MRRILVGITFLGIGLGASPARAGLYNSRRVLGPNLPPDRIRFALGELRGLAQPPKPNTKNPLRDDYLRQVASLEERRRAGLLSPVERADLGDCYVRLGRLTDAERVLTEGGVQHFLIEANLATTYFERKEYELALRHQRRTLAMWPALWAEWPRQPLQWYRRAETYFLKLIQSRLEEERLAARGGAFRNAPRPLDPLFPGVRFVGPSGKYEAGALAPEMADRLPTDALLSVLQLAQWLPGDDRLLWQVAEVLNVNGQVEVAHDILSPMVWSGFNFQDVREHFAVLHRSHQAMKELRKEPVHYALLNWTTPPAPLAAGPASVACVAYTNAAVAQRVIVPELARRRQMAGMAPEPEERPPQAALPFDWRHVTVGFASGFLVAALLGLQWQEWRRRRQAVPVPAAEPEPAASGSARPEER
jgi:hypothetical protein